jgi:hypothetical protein
MSAARQVPDPAAVAWWMAAIRNAVGCLKPAPDPGDPLAAAAYNEARRQLAAQARAEAQTDPEAGQ